MYFDGIIIGLIAFIMIGLFHPLVIYGEYHFGVKICTLFFCFGIISCIILIIIENKIISATIAIIDFIVFGVYMNCSNRKKELKMAGFQKRKTIKIR